jgi:GNAT superfamily N-acetyltransferase
MSGGVLRNLKTSDIPAALELSAEAGWNQTADDWRMLLELAGCYGIELEGELASTTTLLCYGTRMAWIGMVLTKGLYRGRGFARRLLAHALDLLDQMGIGTVKLDATDQGQPLYEKLGFRPEQAVERWGRMRSADVPRPPNVPSRSTNPNWLAMDARAFGTDRSALLDKLAARTPPISEGNSYLLMRRGRLANYLGPCVAEEPEVARGLIEHALRNEVSSRRSWDLLPTNSNAVAIAQDLGFAPERHLTRMVRGKDLRGCEEWVYAIAGFELG